MRTNTPHIDLLDYRSPIFIAALRDLMRRRGWTNKEVARRTGIYPSAVTEWLKNRSVPNVGTVEDLCRGCGVRIDEFLGAGREIVERTEWDRRKEIWDSLRRADVEQIVEALQGLDQEIQDGVLERLVSRLPGV